MYICIYIKLGVLQKAVLFAVLKCSFSTPLVNIFEKYLWWMFLPSSCKRKTSDFIKDLFLHKHFSKIKTSGVEQLFQRAALSGCSVASINDLDFLK